MHMIAGVDEVGRGPLAGPVIAAAVIILDPIDGVKDSKKLTERQRERLVPLIQAQALAYAYGRVEPDEIDAINIHHATLLAMQRAVEALSIQPNEIWVDGKFAPKVSMPARCWIGGDETIMSISCASILAKVHRDHEMIQYDQLYPEYGFRQHKGYPTQFHRTQLMQHGPTPIHRKSFNLVG